MSVNCNDKIKIIQCRLSHQVKADHSSEFIPPFLRAHQTMMTESGVYLENIIRHIRLIWI